MALNAKQKLFCELYVLSEDVNTRENATAAYSVAYPEGTRESAGRNGHRLLKKDEIQTYITQLRAEKRLKQLQAVQAIEKDNIAIATRKNGVAKALLTYVEVNLINGKKTLPKYQSPENPKGIYYDISDRRMVTLCQAANMADKLSSSSIEDTAKSYGLPAIEDFIVKNNIDLTLDEQI